MIINIILIATIIQSIIIVQVMKKNKEKYKKNINNQNPDLFLHQEIVKKTNINHR